MRSRIPTVISKDGTRIAYDRVGHGPVVMLVLGALNSRKSGVRLAKLLASRFTVISYDRRGRGDNTDTASYAPQREVEDVAAIIDEVGGPVYLYGHSSGAAIALQAAIKLHKQVRKLAVYEAPYSLDGEARRAANEYYALLKKLLASGRNGDAVALFIRFVGVSDKQIQAIKRMPMWRDGAPAPPCMTSVGAVMPFKRTVGKECPSPRTSLSYANVGAMASNPLCAMRLKQSAKPSPMRNSVR